MPELHPGGNGGSGGGGHGGSGLGDACTFDERVVLERAGDHGVGQAARTGAGVAALLVARRRGIENVPGADQKVGKRSLTPAAEAESGSALSDAVGRSFQIG